MSQETTRIMTYDSHDYNEFVRENWLFKRDSYSFEELMLEKSDKNLVEFLKDALKDTSQLGVFHVHKNYVTIINDFIFISISYGGSIDKVKIHYVPEEEFNIKEAIEKLGEEFKIMKSYINWVYDVYSSNIILPIDSTTNPIQEMYPILGDTSIEDFYDGFNNSSASVLLLLGPPGTGKTTFIKGMIKHSGSVARVCYDEKVLEQDGVFTNFMESGDEFFIMEDADKMISSRTDGNTMMHKFLNIADGVISSRRKKLIFSTNLPSVRDIDPALIRPGRCYSVMNFGLLNLEQAEKLAKRIGHEDFVGEVGKEYSAAEIFNSRQEYSEPTKKIGFI